MNINSFFKRCISMAVVLVLGLSLTCTVSAEIPYDGYIFDQSTDQTIVVAPNGYLPQTVLQASNFGLDRFLDPQDLFVASDGKLYILDSGNNRIVVLTQDLELDRVIDTFPDANGNVNFLKEAKGIFVAEDGRLIIADSGNERVLVTDNDGTVQRIIQKPKTDLLDKEWVFTPLKVVEDTHGLIYVLADRLVEGSLVFDTNNEFMGFYGSNTVEANPVLAFWKSIMSSVQLSYMEKSVPLESANYFIDANNFIYAVNSSGQSDDALVKKFNPNGKSVTKAGVVYGDHVAATGKRFVDITVDEDGFLYILDSSTSKVYMHNTDGELLSVFGGTGDQYGTFKQPISLVHIGLNILVLDAEKGTITVFAPTDFILDVRQAVNLYNEGLFIESLEPWEKVLRQDTNYYMANYGIAKAMYMQGEYKTAMQYYKRTYGSAEGYSDAFKEYRRLLVQEYLIPIAFAVIVAAVLISIVVKILRKKRGITTVRQRKEVFALSVIRHPFDAFTRIKSDGAGSIFSAVVVVLLFMASCVLSRGEKSYMHNEDYGALLNVPMILLSCLAGFVLFTIANWSICTLTEGKGKYVQIFKVGAYSLLPYTLAVLISVLLSHCLTADEGSFLAVIVAVGVIWSVILLLIGLQTIHMYTMGKTIASCLLTILGMAIIVFIGVLFYSLLYQVYMFIATVIHELQVRG